MRWFYLLLLVLLATAVATFAAQNPQLVPVRYLDREADMSVPALAGACYVLGMLSGWAVVGVVRKWLSRAGEQDRG